MFVTTTAGSWRSGRRGWQILTLLSKRLRGQGAFSGHRYTPPGGASGHPSACRMARRWARRPEGVCGRAGAILPTFCVLDRRRLRVAIGFSRTGRPAPFLWHNVFRRMAELVAIGWCGRSGAALIGHFVIADCRRKNSFRWACALARTVSRLPESRRGHRGSMSSRR